MADDGDVIGVIDRSTDVPLFVLSEKGCDGAWMAIPDGEAPTLDEWR